MQSFDSFFIMSVHDHCSTFQLLKRELEKGWLWEMLLITSVCQRSWMMLHCRNDECVLLEGITSVYCVCQGKSNVNNEYCCTQSSLPPMFPFFFSQIMTFKCINFNLTMNPVSSKLRSEPVRKILSSSATGVCS